MRAELNENDDARVNEGLPWGSGHRILVVDDEPDVVQMLHDHITVAGFAVDTALNGGEALMLVRHARPDVVLLDFRIPGIDGVEVLRHIRASDATIPVIIVTALTDADLARATLRVGAFEYVTKPIDLASLDRVILAALQGRGEPTGRDAGKADPSGACRELTDAVLSVVRQMAGPAGLSLPERLKTVALAAAGDAAAGDTVSAARSLRQAQILFRACVELGDLSAAHRDRLEAALIRVQKALLRAG